MAATLQRVRPKTTSKTKSYLHVKRVLAVAISSISYIRHLFPDDAFVERKVDDMTVRIMRQSEKTGKLISWMSGVYDALEKEFLKRLYFIISFKCPETGKEITETYKFSFTYTGGIISTDVEMDRDGRTVKTSPITDADTKRSAQKFIRNLFSMVSSFEPIRSLTSITMHLTYYDEKCPEEYQPEGFEAAEEDFCDVEETISIGELVAPSHSMKLDVIIRPAKTDYVSYQQDGMHMKMDIENQENATEIPSPSFDKNIAPDTQPFVTATQSTQGFGVRCPCGYNEDDGSMIRCVVCNYWQHAICFCVTDQGCLGAHTCNICCDVSKAEFYPTDVSLLDKTDRELQETCMWRRSLKACFETTKISVILLSGRLSCTKALAKKMVDKLVGEGVAKPVKGQRSSKDIDRSCLESVFYRDVNKIAMDMRKQAIEVKTRTPDCHSKANCGAHENVKSAITNVDETPMKVDVPTPDNTRSAKRRLSVVDSQDSVFQAPAAPAKSKKKRR